MGVDETEALEANGGRTETLQAGNDDPLVIADDDEDNFPSPADQQAELAVDVPGCFGELAGQIVGQNEVGSDAAPVELFDPLYLLRPQSVQVAVDFLNGGPPVI